MKNIVNQFVSAALIAAVGLLAMQNACGLGHDFFTNKVASLPLFVEYPKGFEELVNATNRIAGYDVNSESVYFFSGNAPDFTRFLEEYANIRVPGEHRLVLRDGVGEARSPWAKSGRPCDWKLYSAPQGRLEAFRLMEQGTNSPARIRAAAHNHTNYLLVVDFWTGGRVALKEVRIPANIKVTKAE